MPEGALAAALIEYRYFILVPLAFVEGPIVALVAGFLASLGYINLWLVLAIFITKDVVLDGLFYTIGRYGNRDPRVKAYAMKVGIREEHWAMLEHFWRVHPWRAMFIGKVAYGLAFPFLVSAGFIGVSYRKFVLRALPITVFLHSALISLGYYTGSSVQFTHDVFVIMQIALVVALVVAVVFYVASTRLRRRFLSGEHKD